MDKKVIFAVAGSGKTRRIVEHISSQRRALVIAYTRNATEELSRRIITKYGHMPDGVRVSTYFSFLDRFCYRPLFSQKLGSKGITFKQPTQFSSAKSLTDNERFMDAGRRIYHCRMASLLTARGAMGSIIGRLERYYDDVFLDEIQDFGGHDFKFLIELSRAAVSWQIVGDFFQHTYDTSRDQNVSRGLHDDYFLYQSKLREAGFTVDTISLIESHRCSDDVCAFISQYFGIAMKSASGREGKVSFVDDKSQAAELHADETVLKLFLQEPYRYCCFAMTWGGSKGLDCQNDVCVVVNDKTWKQINDNRLSEAAPLTKNKLYVACTRARRHLYLVPEKLLKDFKAEKIAKSSASEKPRSKHVKRSGSNKRTRV